MLKSLFKFNAKKDVESKAQDNLTSHAKGMTENGMTHEQALAQYMMSGILSEGFYRSASSQLRKLHQLCQNVSDMYLAQAALYTYEERHMKEVPAYLLALLSLRDIELTKKIFPRIITNGRMLRCFTQIIRSGAIGRRSFGTSLVRIIGDWINALSDAEILGLYVGKNPTLRDILRLVHPRPENAEREAFYGWICQLGSKHLGYNPEKLPPLVKELEAFLKGEITHLSPEIPHALLISKSGYHPAQWEAILKNCNWNQLRQSLNLFQRQNVFKRQENIDFAVKKLTNPDSIKSANLHPQALYASFTHLAPDMPRDIKSALNKALEMLLEQNLPDFKGHQVAVCLDLSSSMFAPVSGYRGKATSKAHCADIASMSAAMVLKGNPKNTIILPFASHVFPMDLNPQDSVLTNMTRINSRKKGGTDCSAPLGYLLDHDLAPDVIILISDNESWIETGRRDHGGSTQAYKYWQKLHENNPNASLICWNLAPNTAFHVSNDSNVLNLAGYSEHLFQVILRFSNILPLKKSSMQQAIEDAEKMQKISL
ncbi:hypothetical protein FAI41_04345 [Acetobacteraceae bacterium]|nr:hypothetical protein FAI41_04345 [Acetobacteraceae bacterium]